MKNDKYDTTNGLYDLTVMGGRVAYLREKKKMSQTTLARVSGLTQPAVSMIEKGTTTSQKVRASTLLRLAAALDSTVEYIREGKGDPHHAMPGDAAELLSIYEDAPPHVRAALIAAARALK